MRKWLHNRGPKRHQDQRRSKIRRSGRLRQLSVESLEERLPLAISTELVKDINTLPSTVGSWPDEFTQVGNLLFFTANSNPRELWKTDGTSSGTVMIRSLYDGKYGAPYAKLWNLNEELLFWSNNNLWKSDGSSAGTEVVKSFAGISTGLLDSVFLNGSLFLAVRTGIGIQLWKTDGTNVGTVMVKGEWSGSMSSFSPNLVNVSGTLFFQASDSTNGYELWKSDGTSAGTLLVKDIRTGASSTKINSPTNVNGTLYFSANDGTSGYQLWKSDGTTVGTTLVKVVNSGPGSKPSGLTNVGGVLYFTAIDSLGYELWKSDGTATGTVIVKDIWPGNNSSTPSNLVDVNGTVYFAASSNSSGVELWKSDGTSNGTVLVKDIQSGTSSSWPRNLLNQDGTLFFTATNSTLGNELWKSDGTQSGTLLVKEINVGVFTPEPQRLTPFNGILYFSANSGGTGRELWRSDGSNDGTFLLKDIHTGNLGSSLTNFTDVNGTLFFVADDGIHGLELWKSDGSNAGTVVMDLRQGSLGSEPRDLTNVNGTLFFTARDSVGRKLYKTDGTSAGTVVVASVTWDTTFLISVGSRLFFVVGFDVLWTSDGTAAGTVLVKAFSSDALEIFPRTSVDVAGTLYFRGKDVVSGYELWKSDGTSSGTVLVKDIQAGSGNSGLRNLTNVNGTLYFVANDGTRGYELWKSGGTSTNTVIVRDIRSGAGDSLPDYLTNVNGTLYFQANDSVNGTELWKSDGTLAGTSLVNDLRTGLSSSIPKELTNVSGTLYFYAISNANRFGIWKSDGTSAGTVLIKEISPGFNFNASNYLVNFGGTLYFAASDVTGRKLWTSDGTASGTRSLGELVSPNSVRMPERLTPVGDILFYTSVDNQFNEELWKVYDNKAPTDISLSSSNLIENAGSNAIVASLMTSDPNVGNTFTYTLTPGVGDADNSFFNIAGTTLRANNSFNFEEKSSYLIRIRSTDQGGLFTEKAFTITIGNANEVPLDLVLAPNAIAENAGANITVGGLSTIDPDVGESFTYALVAGSGDTGNSEFKIVGNTLVAIDSLDFESNSQRTVRIRSTDQGGLFLEKIVTVVVVDVNDSPIDIAVVPSVIPENSGSNATVGSLVTSDPDTGNSFTYALVTGAGSTDNAAFNIVGTTLMAAVNFNFEVKSSYSIRVRSTDQGGLFTEKSLSVAVSDINESPTDLLLSTTSIPENRGVNASVGTFATTDPDFGGSFVYTLVSGVDDTDNAAFSISGSILRASNSFDFETKSSYSIRVRSTDQGGLFVEKSFSITVTNVNEAPTDIALSAMSLAENLGVNASVGALTSVDQDAAGSFTYTLVAGVGDNDNGTFNINGATLRATNSLDFEAKSSYTVRVRSTDQGGLFTEKTFLISVSDANDSPTDIILSVATLAENSGVNAVVGTLSTTDPDAGSTFVYTLASGTGDIDNAAFNIDGSTLRANSSFDFESRSSYTVRVRSTDQGGLFIEKAFTISVIDVNEAPVDITLAPSAVAENAGTNATVGNLSTTDLDADNSFAYTLVAGVGDVDNALFSIVGATLKAVVSFDFETRSSYSVRIRSTDQGGLFAEKVITVSVADSNEMPLDIALSQSAVAENVEVNTPVGVFNTIDPDNGDTFSYSLVSGTGDSDNTAFNIAGSTLRTTASFNFESKPTYTIRIRSTDQGGLFTEESFTLTVTDVNETPTDIALSQLSIAENTGLNATIGALTTVDQDAGNSFSYSLVAGAGDGDNGLFNISSSTLRAANSFDFEAKSTYSIRVRSTDQGGLFTEKTFTISVTNVNEIPAGLFLSAATIAENSGIATVGTLSTTDLDVVDSFVYALVAGIGDADNGEFNITGNTLSASRSFDFEAKSSYTVRIRSTDQGGLFIEKVFNISVTDVNEAPVDIAISQLSIAENAGVNATVGTLSSIDPDAADAFSYSLVSGAGDADNSVFNISGSTLRANSSFNYESKSSYAVRVRSTDRAGLFFERSFLVAVTDVNEAPVDVDISISTVDENAGANAIVGKLNTLDPDAGEMFSYSLVSGLGDKDNSLFNISDDKLRANNSFDFESISSYTIRVRATDQSGLSTEKTFVINVSDRNDTPTDLAISKSSVAENASQNAIVGFLSTSDPDAGNTFSYALVEGMGDADNALFNLSGVTLRANGTFDFESKSNYTVRVRSTDQGGLSTEKIFTISVVDLNEAPLSIQLSNAGVAEGLPVGTEVGTFSTSDSDSIDAFSYRMVSGVGSDDSGRFTISGNSLKTNAIFDYQFKSSYSIRVRSTDKGSLSTEAVFRIDVRDTTKPMLVSVERSKALPNPTNGSELEFVATFSEAVTGGGASSFVVVGDTTAGISAVTSLSPTSYLVKVSGGDLDRFNGIVKIALSSSATIQDLSGNALQSSIPSVDEAFLVDHAAPEVTVDQQTANRVRPTIFGNVSDATALITVTVAGRNYTAVNDGNGQWSLNGANLIDPLQAGRNEIAVSARDAAGNIGRDSTSQEILVILQAPTDLQFLPERVHDQMDSLTSDILFGQLSAKDLDPVDQLSFQLIPGAGDQDNSLFFISGNNIYLRQGQILNYDTKPQYSVRVQASDLAGNNIAAPIQLRLQPLPVAKDDKVALVQGRQMVVDVKANDLAPDNNLQQLTIRLLGQSSSSIGTIEVTADNRILLTANSNAYGVLTVNYRLSDPRGGESRDAKIQFGVTRSPKQNPWFQLDVNDNGLITPSDALMIINVLNDPTSERLVPDGLPTPAYLDVNGDKRISPSDALVVINYLNSRTASEGESSVDYSDLTDLEAKAKKMRLRSS